MEINSPIVCRAKERMRTWSSSESDKKKGNVVGTIVASSGVVTKRTE
jgi:hypothetical protein